VFTDDFITLENDYWLQCYLDGVPLHPANLFGNCQEDLYSNIEPELPECYGLNSVLTIDEIPGQIDFSCE
jgi:hypothetical protein